jgi:nucleoside-diphosphate-sugar epimerase
MLLSEASYFIIGGAGFIGSHFMDALLASEKTRRVTIFDNFSSGREWHYEAHRRDPRLNVVHADACDINALTATMEGHDWVIHLASNPDIAAAAERPEIDFYQGTLLTNNVVEAMRVPACAVCFTLPAAASTATRATSRSRKILPPWCPSPRTAPASWPANP